jgi:hypothetical protein
MKESSFFFRIIFNKNNCFHRAILLAGSTFDADRDVNMRLRFSFCDGITLTTCYTGATLNTGISNNIWHFT